MWVVDKEEENFLFLSNWKSNSSTNYTMKKRGVLDDAQTGPLIRPYLEKDSNGYFPGKDTLISAIIREVCVLSAKYGIS